MQGLKCGGGRTIGVALRWNWAGVDAKRGWYDRADFWYWGLVVAAAWRMWGLKGGDVRSRKGFAELGKVENG